MQKNRLAEIHFYLKKYNNSIFLVKGYNAKRRRTCFDASGRQQAPQSVRYAKLRMKKASEPLKSLRSTRRTFLKIAGVSGASLGLGGAATAYLAKPRPEIVTAPEPDLPKKLHGKKRILVVGGGLAGLSAAIELAERGFDVDLFEAGSHCGGRVGGWQSWIRNSLVTQEHGFHGFFYHYYNLLELIGRTCDAKDFIRCDTYPVAVKNKSMEFLHHSTASFPFNLLKVVWDSPNLQWNRLSEGSPSHLLDLLSYHPVETFRKYDKVSFKQWCKDRGTAPVLEEILYDPYVRTMFVRPDEVSAAEMIQLFHSYFMANPEGIGIRVLRRPSLEALITPLTEYFQKLGGRLHTSAPVHALHIEENRVAGIVRKVAGERKKIASLPASQLPNTGFLPLPSKIGPIFVGKTNDQLTAFHGLCTHQGCPLQFSSESKHFHCPCHQGVFDADGKPLSGPPKTPLPQLKTQTSGDLIDISTTFQTGDTFLPADHVILAVDIPGVQTILSNTSCPATASKWTRNVQAMQTARPYSVARQWLDKPVQTTRHPLYTLGAYHPVDELFIISQFQDEAIEWAKKNGGSVIETHCYALDAADTAHPEKLADKALEIATEILPELQGSRVLHRETQLLQNAPAYSPGEQTRRPGTATPFPNLHLAGDYVRIDLPVELMERATVSGKLAANEILAFHGVQRVKITTPPLNGIFSKP